MTNAIPKTKRLNTNPKGLPKDKKPKIVTATERIGRDVRCYSLAGITNLTAAPENLEMYQGLLTQALKRFGFSAIAADKRAVAILAQLTDRDLQACHSAFDILNSDWFYKNDLQSIICQKKVMIIGEANNQNKLSDFILDNLPPISANNKTTIGEVYLPWGGRRPPAD